MAKKKYETEHYIFTFEEGSLADKEILLIAKRQEECFLEICATLKTSYNEKINYYLTDSPEEIGKLYNGDACNGLTVFSENAIYAVYNDKVKCIGPHEDAHMISLNMINCPNSDFLVEGLAMYFDQKWWGIDNDLWTKFYSLKKEIDIFKYLNDDNFYDIDYSFTYPIAGCFTKFLISKYGIDLYLELFKSQEGNLNTEIERVYCNSLEQIKCQFNEYLALINLSDADNLMIIKELNDNNK